VVLGPRFLRKGIPQISDVRFQIALTSENVADFGSVPFSELREQKYKRIAVKPESAD